MSEKSKQRDVYSDSRAVLEYVYSKIPDTKGCIKNIGIPVDEGGCGAWCCMSQNPQVLYSEFRNSWHAVEKDWDSHSILDLIERSIKAYLFEEHRRGCVFWDRGTLCCSQHNTRPFNCRIYGITPEEEWKPRYERLKVLYPDTKDQCSLVSTKNGKEFSKKNLDKVWELVKNVEKSIGIKKEDIHDDFGGSYRHYYEHILLHLMGEEGMIMLSDMREHGSDEDKESILRQVINSLKSFFGEENESEGSES